MLHRSASSRRRRASRSTASSPQIKAPRSAGTSPGRRASIAVSPIDSDSNRKTLVPDMNRSPRHSIIPDISFDSRDNLDVDCISPRSPRPSLIPDSAMSPRNSLIPDTAASRSARHSLVPDNYSRSPRNSLVPDSSMSPRNSLTPETHNRSSRNSLVADYNRSSRHSLVPDSNPHSSRMSLAPDFNRSPRNSLCPDGNRSSRLSLTPSESTTWNHRISPNHEEKGLRHNSPRGSIAPESLNVRTSPRGSIVSEHQGERSPRGSIGAETNHNRSPRASLARNNLVAESCEHGRSPRGSLTLTFQEPPLNERRLSADNPSVSRVGGRSTSPYRSSSRGVVNQGYNSGNVGLTESGSRRASSSVSQVKLPQVSGDEQRRLCAEQKHCGVEPGLGLGLSLTTYGSVAYQLKDANMEATSTCDFICKALTIVKRTVVVTVLLVCLSTLPLLMVIMGVQFLRDCPREPHIPVYMVVGGGMGCVQMAWILYRQLRNVRIEENTLNASSIGSKVASFALGVFLITWYALGNYWILRIKWPDYVPTLFEPNRWCHRTLYVFSLVHLCVIYSVMGVLLVFVVALASCQLFGCSWLGPTRYK